MRFFLFICSFSVQVSWGLDACGIAFSALNKVKDTSNLVQFWKEPAEFRNFDRRAFETARSRFQNLHDAHSPLEGQFTPRTSEEKVALVAIIYPEMVREALDNPSIGGRRLLSSIIRRLDFERGVSAERLREVGELLFIHHLAKLSNENELRRMGAEKSLSLLDVQKFIGSLGISAPPTRLEKLRDRINDHPKMRELAKVILYNLPMLETGYLPLYLPQLPSKQVSPANLRKYEIARKVHGMVVWSYLAYFGVQLFQDEEEKRKEEDERSRAVSQEFLEKAQQALEQPRETDEEVLERLMRLVEENPSSDTSTARNPKDVSADK